MDGKIHDAAAEDDRLIDTHEAARLLGMGYRTLINARIYGGPAALPWVRIGRNIRYSTREIERYIRANTRTSTSE